jgi:hypothetical protein
VWWNLPGSVEKIAEGLRRTELIHVLNSPECGKRHKTNLINLIKNLTRRRRSGIRILSTSSKDY